MEALTYHDKVADSPWKDMCLPCNLAQGDRLPVRYTRAGLPSGNYDIKTYDIGNLHVFVDGVAASTNLGLLEVNYSVDLYTPQIQNPVGGQMANTAGLDATHLMGTLANVSLDPQALLPGAVTTTQVFTFSQAFEGIVAFQIGGTGLGSDFAPVAAGVGAAAAGLITNVDAGATKSTGAFRVQAQPGTTLTPTITATTVTSVEYNFAKCAYNQTS